MWLCSFSFIPREAPLYQNGWFFAKISEGGGRGGGVAKRFILQIVLYIKAIFDFDKTRVAENIDLNMQEDVSLTMAVERVIVRDDPM